MWGGIVEKDCILRAMSLTYQVFAVALGGIAFLGAFAGRRGIGEYVCKRAELVVTIIVGATAAGILSFAFLIEQLKSTEVGLGALFQNHDGLNSFGAVVWQLAVGGAGLLVALGIVALGKKPRGGRLNSLLRSWAGGCLITSGAIVVLLFPATIALILSAGDISL